MWNLRRDKQFARLIAPMSTQEFLDFYYERQMLHVRRGYPDDFGTNFGLADLEDVIYGTELRRGALRLSKNGSEVASGSYTRKVQRVDDVTGELRWVYIVDPHRVGALFGQGCTIIFDDLRPFSAQVARFTGALESFFGHKIFCAAFLTPPDSQGFGVHYDVVDSFILQIEGEKNWAVSAPSLALPLEHQKYDRKTCRPGRSLLECALEPGDVLYLPRGTYHEARANAGGHTLHLSVGLAPIRWNSVIEKALQGAAETQEALRASTAVPLDDDVLAGVLARTLCPENIRATLARMEEDVAAARRGAQDGQLQQILASSALSDQTEVEPARRCESTSLKCPTRESGYEPSAPR